MILLRPIEFSIIVDNVKIRKKAYFRNPYNQIPHLTQDTIWESDKHTRKHHKQENQEVSPFPAGDHTVTRYDTNNKYKDSTKEATPWNGQ